MRFALFVLLIACNQVYGLERTTSADGPPPGPDRDNDGVADVNDNCMDVPNANQHDEDKDTVGDLCDNCPLLSNFGQENTGDDNDDVGDACDPNPVATFDCLVLFDSFLDPSEFAQHWTGAGTSPSKDGVKLVNGNFLNKDLANRIFDVEVVGSVEGAIGGPGPGAVSALTNGGVADKPSLCEVEATGFANELAAAEFGVSGGNPMPSFRAVANFSARPVGKVTKLLTLRLTYTVSLSAGGSAFGCRVDYGYAVGVVVANGGIVEPNAKGSPGVSAKAATAHVDAIAIYIQQPSPPCMPPVIR